MLEFVFLLAGIAVGFTFRPRPEPVAQDPDPDLKEQLVVAQNLSVSLLQDLEQAKETIRKLKNAS